MGNCVASPSQVVQQRPPKTPKTLHEGEDTEDSVVSTDAFVYTKKTCALEYWDPMRLLGEGSISTVHLVRRRQERVAIPYNEHVDVMTRAQKSAEEPHGSEDWSKDELYALKSIAKDHISNDKILREMKKEIFTMSKLSHSNIVRVTEGYERKRHLYLVMECCRGGDLLQVEGTTEQHAKAILRRVLSAVAYMHENGVVHRDLKLENIMFATPHHKASEVKVIDFGLATKYLSSDYKKLTDKVGTVYTMAPQVMQGVYDNKCDMWSLGVVAYILLSAIKPFWGPSVHIPWTERRAIMIDRIIRADYVDMEGGKWDTVSDAAKNFVKSLLQLDPEKRPSAKQALESKWMQTRNDMDVENLSEMTPQQKQERAKRLAVLLVMEKTSSSDILKLQNILQRYDPEETGYIALADLRKALAETGRFDAAELDKALPELDEDKKQRCVDHVDFLTRALEKRERMETDQIFATLNDLDTNRTGRICLQKLRDHVYEQTCEGSGNGGAIPSEWTQELDSLGEGDDEVEIREVLTWFGRQSIRRLESLRNIKAQANTTLKELLATPANAQIPGGRLDPYSKKLFFYDERSSSMRRIPVDD